MDAHSAVVSASGFREYDARWRYELEINKGGIYQVGLALGTMLLERTVRRRIVTGYDFRSYSATVQQELNEGLMAAGCVVYDIGLALTPTAYFAQYALDVPAVAVVTASHNENGWTGIKMGFERPFTFGPEEITALRKLVLGQGGRKQQGGGVRAVSGMKDRYISDPTKGRRLRRSLKVVIGCGNGTAGAFAPVTFQRIGCEVVPLHCEPDHSFPNYNPNPEDLTMLRSLSAAVARSGADLGLAFDGDGDRCGVVDNEGRAIFADKMGVLLARRLSKGQVGTKFVVDVKSTGLYQTDPVLSLNGAETEYWKTGHSYMKRRVVQTGAIAGFEKSRHYFFNAPFGRGYDDGLLSGIAICEMVADTEAALADLYRELPQSWLSATVSPHCADDRKYRVVEAIAERLAEQQCKAMPFAGQRIAGLNRVNGVRILLEDGSWGLVRASSNKPELVIVCGSPRSEQGMREIFGAIERMLGDYPEAGPSNQALTFQDQA